MSLERDIKAKIQEAGKPLDLDQRLNPGAYRTGKRQDCVLEEPRTRLPDATRAFVQRAFADGVVERMDTEKARKPEDQQEWERRKWLLVRHVIDDNCSSHNELRRYAGIRTISYASRLYLKTLADIWLAAPPELQAEFPLKEISKGKRGGALPGCEVLQEVRERISQKLKGRWHSEGTKIKMMYAQCERRRRELLIKRGGIG
ncbi:MAG: hypothetical protein JOZ60_07340 [Verrucomicrobia bacterium]|nr:hypothetical protein [Verrucomicrobiota bacterium]